MSDCATVDIVVPVHNEQTALAANLPALHTYVRALPYDVTLTIADNASTDATFKVATRLADELAGVRVRRLPDKGRGHALRDAWTSSSAQVLAYMDVDLSTDLTALPELLRPLVVGEGDVAIGTRLADDAQVTRRLTREVVSRGYNLLLHGLLDTGFSDAQCGFKAIRADRAEVLLPQVIDHEWFFDTELLVLAERAGMRIHEVPVVWVDDPDSRVAIVPTALADLRGIARVRRALRVPPEARDLPAPTPAPPPRPTLAAPPDPPWARPALLGLLAITALLYLGGLGSAGWANAYYAAAAQAASQSWHAMLFGAVDGLGAITVDKPPASVWVMGMSARLFGVNSWSILLPQALAGTATVALLYAAVRRAAGPGAGLLAGGVFAVTPVAVLLFRYNNPDALLVLLLVAAAWATVRGIEDGRTRWIVLVGGLLGFAFLTKLLQALLVVPALAGVWLYAAPGGLLARLRGLLAGGLALVVAGGWYVALVELWPASARPYVGGSTSNSLVELTLGYNGVARLTGDPSRALAPDSAAGPLRLLTGDVGSHVGWLLPAAVIVAVVAVWLRGRAPRTDPVRASLLLWGGWLLVTGVVFSGMQGIFHPYYTLALAPAVAALLGIGTRQLWDARERVAAELTLATVVAGSALFAASLLAGMSRLPRGIGPVVIAAATVAVVGMTVGVARSRRWCAVAAGAGLVALLTGPVAVSVATARTPSSGVTPTVATATVAPTDTIRARPVGRELDMAALTALLTDGPRSGTWGGATVGSHLATRLQLESGVPMLSLGGFAGHDPAPTLAQFQQAVAAGRVRYYLEVAGLDTEVVGDRPGSAHAIARWVAGRFPSREIGGMTVYDLEGRTPPT